MSNETGMGAAGARKARRRARMRRGSPLAAVMLTALLAGCAILPKTPDSIYDLAAPSNVATRSGSAAQLLVPVPAALASLDTTRIAARPTPGELAYLPNAAWPDALPRVLQARLVETLQNTGRVKAVGLPGQGLLIDYQVVLDVRAFELVSGTAVAEFNVKLLNDRNGRVVASRTFRAESPVGGKKNADIVSGLNRAMDAAFADIVEWTLTRV
ncbi:ABC-type transport auxiliary lipoprotein family protein [Afifella sp. IM 167]|uniref:ABC-type transport auxiliary lipoprotein family protein n=1 Tax=Afifella sp. IM 167 TaxID=2033586 RepID=UPI001CCA13A5|nr:ABC-type transport auxiliary lipoprotein family protein [Afifella sp. IM 167]MBZ8135308.1 ABC transporter [Afifella sp. IM 167]